MLRLFPTPCTLPPAAARRIKKKAQTAVENPFLNFKVASEPRLSLSLPSEIQEKAVCRCREHRELTALFVSSAPSLPTPALGGALALRTAAISSPPPTASVVNALSLFRLRQVGGREEGEGGEGNNVIFFWVRFIFIYFNFPPTSLPERTGAVFSLRAAPNIPVHAQD